MTRTQIRLDTLSDVNKFVDVMSKVKGQVWLADDDGSRVNAKSLLGALYSMEWTRIYCYCESNITAELMPWMV
jgi:hypothetical protein